MITNKGAKQKVEELIDLGMSNFSSWELEFLDSIQDWSGEFSEKQLEIIEKLVDEKL